MSDQKWPKGWGKGPGVSHDVIDHTRAEQIETGNAQVYLEDSDFTLYVGDVREVLAQLPDGCVDCVITSPPYWGLRDYGTGSWVGGDEGCDHQKPKQPERSFKSGSGADGRNCQSWTERDGSTYLDVCGKCGATRQDQQLGLEPTPDQYVENMIAVFRDIRRVLADHGTCWVNLGDSYNAYNGNRGLSGSTLEGTDRPEARPRFPSGYGLAAGGLKPKDLVGIPWRVAFALQADGWYLRSDIIWAKPNPMPESVTDRPTKAHEYVFLLSKRPRYWFDAEAVREPHTAGNTQRQLSPDRKPQGENGARGSFYKVGGQRFLNPSGRNARTVWEIATQPYPEAHFATYPEELVRRCLLAGCPLEVCRVCGKPRERIVERGELVGHDRGGNYNGREVDPMVRVNPGTPGLAYEQKTVGWSDCDHQDYRPGIVLDPFLGSGTTAVVARKHARHTIGIELNPTYAELAAKRTRQLSLLT